MQRLTSIEVLEVFKLLLGSAAFIFGSLALVAFSFNIPDGSATCLTGLGISGVLIFSSLFAVILGVLIQNYRGKLPQ